MTVAMDKLNPSEYLTMYMEKSEHGELSFPVDFSQDEDSELCSRNVSLPLTKLVFGFANGWANTSDEKTLYVSPEDVQQAWTRLCLEGRQPRGFMFWTINSEGLNDIYFARALSRILDN